jgi:drug/metabolite transporter (DMT)-like permease
LSRAGAPGFVLPVNPALGFIIPATCALLYVVAAMMLKRAGALGVGPWRIGFLANWVMLFVYLPWGLMQPGAEGPMPTSYWQPALNALLFLVGQTFTFLALQKGDVSVTAPVMGTKVLLVALLTLLLRAGGVPTQWWVAAALSTAAVVLLHFGEPHAGRTKVGRTVVLTGLSALAFSLNDVLLQKWGSAWGSGRYVTVMFVFNAIYTFSFVPFFRAPLRSLDRRAWLWTGGGAVLLAVNNAAIALAIAVWKSPIAVNILYSLRGLFSVVLVWAVGHWFANEEQHLTPRVFRVRLAGAALMLSAVVLVLL